ncbi:MAG: right-handed parallel beta-helix repeat-containing protein [bacterium]
MKKILKYLTVGIILGINIGVYAADLYVPGSYTTIQSAVNTATTGDTIYVGTGTYNEALYINKSIALVGAGADVCTITTTGLGYVNVVTFDGTGGTITGFTIRETYMYGIYCINNANPVITNNTISGNNYDGIFCFDSSPTITNNIISGNRYKGIYCDSSSPFITNNIIVRNRSHGIYCDNSSPSTMNNIITENGISKDSYGIYVRSGNPTVDYNCVWGNGSNTTNNYYNCVVGLYNISLDPQFIGQDDYHLSSNSLCIDAGSNTAPGIPEKDKDGNTRIVNDRVDIGAYEYQGSPTGLYSLSGTVTDTNGNPISNALVKVISEILIKSPAKSPGRGEAITDNNGSFTISNLPFGTYTIRASSVGYYQSYRNLLINGQISNIEFKMVSTQSLTIYVNRDNTSGTENGSLEFPYTTINRGVDNCFKGGTVFVSSGIYNEAIYINKSISLIGQGANVCTITTTGLGYVNAVTFDGAGGTITGFTIREAGWDGIYCINNANPTITNNTISESRLLGVHCNNSSPTITNNTISKNGGNGGIRCCNNSSPTITNNIISGNGRHGISCEYSSPTITNNTISENVEDGILCFNSSPTITNNTILKNLNYGIHCKYNSFPTITNNIISGNRYAGIYCDYSSSPFITNNIIVRNRYHGIYCNNSSPSIMNNIITENGTSTDSYGIYVCSGNPSVDYNCVWGNGSTTTNNYYNCVVGLYNISFDPQFIGQDDYHLSSKSLCIDAGSNTAPGIPEKDKDGNPRIINDRVDIGAYEYQGSPTGLYSISGTLTDTNGNPISNALVKVISDILIKSPVKSPCRGEAITDNNGSFTISNLPFGTYTIRASSVGYYQFYRNLLINGQISNIEFKMVSTQSLTIYVNKDNTSGTENGSLESPYTSINRGVDSCFEGGTILVPPGIYNESVYINKSISLIGAGANVCTITTTGLGYVSAVIFDGAGGTITGFTIREAGWDGIYCINNANPTITNNTISKSSMVGVYCYNSSPTITNNRISENWDDGILCYNNSSPTITNNTISENKWEGIRCNNSSPTITNNIIVRTGTTSLNSYGIYVISGSPIIDYNNLWNNGLTGSQNYCNCSPGTHDISENPRFISETDFHLTPYSLCIDAGSNTAPGIQEKDKDGNPRIVNGIVDIGAYEYQGTFTVIISFTGSSTYSNEKTLTETIEERNLMLTSEDSNIVFNEFKRINIKTGGFTDRGFFKGTLTMDNNNCLFKGMSYQKGTVSFLNGVIEGYASGIMELVFEDSSYTGTLTLTQMGDEVFLSTRAIKGSIESSEPDASNKTVTLEQKMIEGEITLTLTIVRIENEGFCVISYNSEEGTGEGYAYVKEKTLDGFLKNPIYGYILAILEDPPEVTITRIDPLMPPMADLDVRICGPDGASPGQIITYVIVLRNGGLKEAFNRSVVAVLPDVEFISTSPGGIYSYPFHTVRWNPTNIPAKSIINFNFQVRIPWGLPLGTQIAPTVQIVRTDENEAFYEEMELQWSEY